MVEETRGSPVVILAELLDQTVRAGLVVETEVEAEVTMEVGVEVAVMEEGEEVAPIPAARGAEAPATPRVVHLEMAALAEQVQPTRLPRRERDDRARGGCGSAGTTTEARRTRGREPGGERLTCGMPNSDGILGSDCGRSVGTAIWVKAYGTLICYGDWISLCSVSLLVALCLCLRQPFRLSTPSLCACAANALRALLSPASA